MTENKVDLSVIVPVTERYDDPKELFAAYKAGVEKTSLSYEFVYVLDGSFPGVLDALNSLKSAGEKIKIIKLAKWFGEATALTIGFEHSQGELLLTLPAYHQIDADEIPKLVEATSEYDMVVARRWPRRDSFFNRLQSSIFHGLLKLVTNFQFSDLGCGARVLKRSLTEELSLYGDQHRFVSLLAYQRGFSIKELDIKQSDKDLGTRFYSLGTYLRRVLDILTVFFLVKFTKKPLRFFGLLGSGVFAIGFLMTFYLVIERLFFGIALADRPAILISTLMVVLGIQIFAIGLIGEIVIFTHAKEMKEYHIEEIIN